MFNVDNWEEVYRLDFDVPSYTNHVYVPLFDKDSGTLCMDYGNIRIDFDNSFYWERELKYLEQFKDYLWAPVVKHIDTSTRKIFIEFTESCNNILFTNRALEDHCADWKVQLKQIIKDLESSNFIKLTIQPHSFYIKDNTLHTFDMYACVDKDQATVPVHILKHVIGQKSQDRWLESTFGDYVDLNVFYDQGVKKHITEWGVLLPEIL